MHEVEGLRSQGVTLVWGFFASFAATALGIVVFLLLFEVVQPERWSDPGLGYVVLILVDSAVVVGIFMLGNHLYEAWRRRRYIAANRPKRPPPSL